MHYEIQLALYMEKSNINKKMAHYHILINSISAIRK